MNLRQLMPYWACGFLFNIYIFTQVAIVNGILDAEYMSLNNSLPRNCKTFSDSDIS